METNISEESARAATVDTRFAGDLAPDFTTPRLPLLTGVASLLALGAVAYLNRGAIRNAAIRFTRR